jgi:hypothetical protein
VKLHDAYADYLLYPVLWLALTAVVERVYFRAPGEIAFIRGLAGGLGGVVGMALAQMARRSRYKGPIAIALFLAGLLVAFEFSRLVGDTRMVSSARSGFSVFLIVGILAASGSKTSK